MTSATNGIGLRVFSDYTIREPEEDEEFSSAKLAGLGNEIRLHTFVDKTIYEVEEPELRQFGDQRIAEPRRIHSAPLPAATAVLNQSKPRSESAPAKLQGNVQNWCMFEFDDNLECEENGCDIESDADLSETSSLSGQVEEVTEAFSRVDFSSLPVHYGNPEHMQKFF